MKTKVERPAVEGGPIDAPRSAIRPGAVERIVLTLPQALVERLTELAREKGLTRSGYIRTVLMEHWASDSMEEVDRQLFELAKRAEQPADGP